MRSAALALAVALDATLGEPPVAWHPVVAMGRLVDRLEARLPAPDDDAAVRAGAVATAAGALVVTGVAAVADRAPWPVRGAVLWGLLSGRLLLTEVAAVEHTLDTAGLDAARGRVARLVSRDTGALSAEQVRAAAVQTLAENVTDAWVATLWWWTVGGLPGAALHRWADTLDSRWGYRDERWARRGRAAARLDDALAHVPARLAGAVWHRGVDAALRTEAARPPSPNGGWTMGAAALATDSRLEKPGAYTLHPTGRQPDAGTVTAALRDARRVLATTTLVALTLALLGDLRGRRGRRGGRA